MWAACFGVCADPVVAVVVSAIVSLTLTPMMCGAILREKGGHGTASGGGFVSHLGDSLAGFYRRTLGFVLRHRTVTLLVTLATLFLTTALYVLMPKSFLPQQDTGLIAVVIKADPDVSFTGCRTAGLGVTAVREISEVADIVSVAGGRIGPSTRRRDIDILAHLATCAGSPPPASP